MKNLIFRLNWLDLNLIAYNIDIGKRQEKSKFYVVTKFQLITKSPISVREALLIYL